MLALSVWENANEKLNEGKNLLSGNSGRIRGTSEDVDDIATRQGESGGVRRSSGGVSGGLLGKGLVLVDEIVVATLV